MRHPMFLVALCLGLFVPQLTQAYAARVTPISCDQAYEGSSNRGRHCLPVHRFERPDTSVDRSVRNNRGRGAGSWQDPDRFSRQSAVDPANLDRRKNLRLRGWRRASSEYRAPTARDVQRREMRLQQRKSARQQTSETEAETALPATIPNRWKQYRHSNDDVMERRERYIRCVNPRTRQWRCD